MKKIYLSLIAILLCTGFSFAQWAIPGTGGTAQWVKVGTFNAYQNGATLRLVAYIHQGYNASNGQDAVYYLTFKTSNGASVDANGFAGNGSFYAIGENGTIPAGNIKWKANANGTSATAFDLYMYLPLFTEQSHYIITCDPSSTWTNVAALGQSDPGAAGPAVLIPPAEFDLPYSKLGVNTAFPISLLSVNGGITTTAPIALSGTTPTLALGYDNVNDFGQIYSISNTVAWKPLQITAHTFDLISDGIVQGLHQSSGGAVGIGTATPAQTLDVNGNIGLGNDQWFVSKTNAGTGVSIMGLAADNNVYVGDLFGAVNTSLFLRTSGVNRIAVTNSGYVGIGTSSPDQMLSVNGNIHAQEVLVNLSGFEDRVFYKTYRLPALTEVKNYIDKNHHLPDFPTETEVIKNGINLGDMERTLTKKIEELTLYLIEKDKELKSQQEQLLLQQRLLLKQQKDIHSMQIRVNKLQHTPTIKSLQNNCKVTYLHANLNRTARVLKKLSQ